MRNKIKNFLISPKSLFIFALLLLIYLPAFVGLLHWDKKADLDGDTAYSFPVHGADSLYYATLADNLIRLKTFSKNVGGVFIAETAILPGYPFFLAASKAVFGTFQWAALFQIFLTALATFLIFEMGRKIFSERIGFAAALLYLLDPTTLFHSITLMSDAPFVSVLLLAVYLLFFKDKTPASFFWGGLLLGVGLFLRPIALFLPIVFLFFLVLLLVKHVSWKKNLLYLFCFITGYSLLVVPWAFRNKAATGHANLAGVAACKIVTYDLPMFLMKKNNKDFLETVEELDQKYNLRSMPCTIENASIYQKIYADYLRQYHIEYLLHHLMTTLPVLMANGMKTAIVTTPPLKEKLVGMGWLQEGNYPLLSTLVIQGKYDEVLDFFRKNKLGPFFMLEYLFWLAVLLLSLGSFLGFNKALNYEDKIRVLFFFSLIAYFAILTAPITGPRYRLPMEPFMFLLAGYGFKRLRTIFKRSS